MEPYDEKRFHLVLAHGIRDSSSSQREASKFWSARFPRAFVTDFAFIAEDTSWGNAGFGFLERALSLLEAVQADRRRDASSTDPDEYLPCVFLCHDLGGSLVQQALVLASQDDRYGRLASDAAILIFCDTPNAEKNLSLWEHGLFHLLSGSDLGSRTPTKLLNELPNTLEELYWAFAGIQRQHAILDVRSKGKADSVDSVDADTKPTFTSRARSTLGSTSDEAGLWNFLPGDTTTEKIFDLIGQAVNRELQPISEEFHNFIQTLSIVDSNNYQLQLARPFPDSLNWIIQHPSYCEWQNLDSKAPNILYFHGTRGSGGAVIASHLITTLREETPDSTVISFSFSKQDLRTQPSTTFYVSLIRQLLLSRPSLFRRVSAISDTIEEEEIFSFEILRNLFLSLLKGSCPSPVFCVIYGAQDCGTFSLDHMVALLEEYRQLSTGVFKVMVIGEGPRHGAFHHATKICRDIDLSDEAWRIASVGAYVRSRIENLVDNHKQWGLCKDDIVNKLCNPPTTFLQTALAMRLLETARIPSTKSAVINAIKKLPSSLDEIYVMALERCQSECPIPLLSLLQWILHSVRPLSLNEIAVIVALSSPGVLSMDHLKLNLPLSIAHDLQAVNGTLIKVTGLQVHFIHKTIGPVLANKWRLVGHDPDSIILSKCLDYLETILGHIATATEESGTSPNLDSMGGAEFKLIGYAVTNWPQHYTRAGDRSQIKARVLELFSKEENVKAWCALYQKYSDLPSKKDTRTDVPTPKFSALDSSLKIASRFGLLDIAKDTIQQAKSAEGFEGAFREALDLAAGHGHEDVVALLLEEGAQSKEAMCLAADGGFMNILETLVKAKPDMINGEDKYGRPPFVLATSNGYEKMTAYLLANGAKSNVVVGKKLTALHLASITGQTDLVRSLINAGIDVKALTDSGNDALKVAAAGGFDDIVTLLLKHGADINGQREDGCTALHLAIQYGHDSTCDVLFESEANIHIETKEGLSPIHLASREGHLGILQKLILGSKDFVNEEAEATGSQEDDATAPVIIDTTADVLSPLQLAASHGHLEVVRELLKYARYNSEKSRATALLLAATGDFTHLVETLLTSGITTVVKDTNGNTALHLATQRQHPEIVAQLLDSKPGSSGVFDVNAVNESAWTPLHLAARSGRLLTLQILLKHDVKLDGVTDIGRTALHIAAYCGHLYLVNELLRQERGHNDPTQKGDSRLIQDYGGQTAFALAVQGGHIEVAEALLSWSPPSLKPLEIQGERNALTIAAEDNREDFVRLLLDNGWDVNAGSGLEGTALHFAAYNDKVSMIKLLQLRGADLNAKDSDGERPLHRAVRRSQIEALKTLLELGADIDAEDESGVTPLWRAAYRADAKSVNELLKGSPNLEARKTTTGWTALHAAYDSPEVTQLLLQAGADPKSINSNGSPSLFSAAEYWKGAATIQYHLDAGVDPNTTNTEGATALHVAAESGILATVKLLIVRGANVNATNKSGEAPIHLAARRGKTDIVEYLLEQNVDPEVHSRLYGTPLMAAAMGDYAETIEILLKKGAKVNATSDDYPLHTAIQTAAWWGTESAVKALLNGGADANVTGGTYGSALCAAIADESLDKAKLLLDADADINYADWPRGTPLEFSLGRQALEIVDLCLERNADVNVVSKGRHGTALIAAIDNGDLSNVKKLLERKADVNLFQPDNSETPAQVAVRKGRQNILEIIVEHGAELSYKDSYGRGLISHAIFWKSVDLLSYLWTQPDVDIDEQDAVKRTPLMIAIIQGTDVVDDLIARGAKVDLQDWWGKTALIHAVSRDYKLIVSKLINGGADPRIKDMRGRDALYWAALESSVDTFDQVLRAMQRHDAFPSQFQHAINAAAAANRTDFVEKLLKEVQYDSRQADEDGWTVLDMAERYGRSRILWLIEETARNISRRRRDDRDSPSPMKPPTEWHPKDMAPGLHRQPDARSITVDSEIINMVESKGVVRANHPMKPGKDGIYYFEVKIENRGDDSKHQISDYFGVGFCEENTPLNIQLGWREGSWGYHGDDGNSFDAGLRTVTGDPYGPKYSQDHTIGCGVNFDKNTAFYTMDGEIIGQAFSNVMGKLYPAISVDKRLTGCIFSVKFWDDTENGNKDFLFKGPYTDPKTLDRKSVV